MILRFYAELNDYLPEGTPREVAAPVADEATVGELIERLGVPLQHVDLIVVDGVSVTREHVVRSGGRVALYPVFETFDVGPEVKLRPRPLRRMRFAVTPELEPLGDRLRERGYDVDHGGGGPGRVLLTTGPVSPGATHALVVEPGEADEQLRWLSDRLHLGP